MSELKPILKWKYRRRTDGTEEFTVMLAEHHPFCVESIPMVRRGETTKAGAPCSHSSPWYRVWRILDNDFAKIDSKVFTTLDEALLYAEKILAETDPEFYLKHAVLTDV